MQLDKYRYTQSASGIIFHIIRTTRTRTIRSKSKMSVWRSRISPSICPTGFWINNCVFHCGMCVSSWAYGHGRVSHAMCGVDVMGWMSQTATHSGPDWLWQTCQLMNHPPTLRLNHFLNGMLLVNACRPFIFARQIRNTQQNDVLCVINAIMGFFLWGCRRRGRELPFTDRRIIPHNFRISHNVILLYRIQWTISLCNSNSNTHILIHFRRFTWI